MNNEQLFEILSEAYEFAVKSMKHFDWCEEYKKAGNNELENSYWTSCQEYDGRTRGLLLAYKILTGKEILPVPSCIKDEMIIVTDDILKEPLIENWNTELVPF